MPKKSIAELERTGALDSGDPLPLLDRLGSPGLVSLLAEIVLVPSLTESNLTQLLDYLGDYRDNCLVTIEWPAVYAAFRHASQGQIREMIHLDLNFQLPPCFAPFIRPSLHTGRMQLERLSPLRDQRIFRNYQKAVQAGQAKGWHAVVYGLFLSLYSLPLRQGMLHYAHIHLRGLVDAAARYHGFAQDQVAEALEKIESSLPVALESILSHPSPSLTVVS